MRHKTTALILLGVCVALAVTAVIVGMTTLRGGGAQAASGSAGEPGAQTNESSAYASPTTTEGPAPTGEPAPEPAAASEPTPSPWAGPEVPEQSEAVTAEYFADAAFLGNSVLSGLWYYDNEQLLPSDTSHWYWQDSLTIMAASPFAAQMADKQFGKIYVEFGINEVTYDKDTLRAAFNTVVDQLQADHPDAIIYLVSVTPVSAYCDANRISRSSVISFNDMLEQIAREQQVWYLDVYPVLCGDDGFLPSDVTPDGVHFTPAHYQKWFEYMKTHYIPDGKSPTVPVETPVPETTETAQTPAA